MIRGGNIGAMDTELLLEQEVKTRDAVTNEELVAWETVGTIWAEKIRNPVSDESFEGDQQVAKLRSFFRVRWAELNETMRVTRQDTDEVTYIKGIEEIDRRKFLILTTEKRDNV